jgi:hypothetical protein
MHIANLVSSYSLEDIDEIGIWVNTVKLACCDKRKYAPEGDTSDLFPTKQPSLSSHRNGAQEPLYFVGANRNAWLSEKYSQLGFTT